MLGKHFFRPVPVLMAEPERIMFCSTQVFGSPTVEMLWGDIAEIKYKSGKYEGLIFQLKNGTSYEFSLLGFEHEDEDLLSQIFREHGLTVKKDE